MHHGISNDFLYSANMIKVTFQDDIGNEVEGYGTGFWIANKFDQLCFITNRHVVDLSYKKESNWIKNLKLISVIITGKSSDTETDLPTGNMTLFMKNPVEKLKFSNIYENDIACFINPTMLHQIDTPTTPYHIPYDFIATKTDITKKITICDFVAFPSYSDFYDKAGFRPIIRMGTIASDPRFDYSHSGIYDGQCIAYEAFSFGGASGSPIFTLQKGINVGEGIIDTKFREVMFIGINAGHLQKENVHSGLSYMYQSPAILDIVDAL